MAAGGVRASRRPGPQRSAGRAAARPAAGPGPPPDSLPEPRAGAVLARAPEVSAAAPGPGAGCADGGGWARGLKSPSPGV